MREKIVSRLREILGDKNIVLEVPADASFGDYSTNIAMQMFSTGKNFDEQEYKSPRELAQKVVEILSEDKDLGNFISKIDLAGPGFINFWVSEEFLFQNISKTLESLASGKKIDIGEGQKVVVEYSSPNIAKPFTVGHLRSTIIGDSIANILEFAGYEVYRDNHLGDWGTQFGKLIYMLKKTGMSDDLSIKDLVELYIKFHQEAEEDPSLEDHGREEFRKLEEGDVENKNIWKFCVDVSLKEFKKIYETLDIEFDENDGIGYGESFFEDKMKDVLKELNEKKLLQEGKEGAKLVFFDNDQYPPLMIVKKDGTTLYATRDLATDKFRLNKYGKDVIIINEVGGEQALYFEQLYKLEEMLGWYKPSQRVHVKHGLFRFKDKKMSTRKGNVIWLDKVLDEAIKRAESFGSENELAQKVAIGALKWNELKRDPVKDIVFDWDELLNMEGNSGPYLQYTYARAKSVLAKSEIKKVRLEELENIKFNDDEMVILRNLSRYFEIVGDGAKNYSPSIVAKYLYDLAQKFNGFYNKYKIVGSDNEEARIYLTMATAEVLKSGLYLLGIEAPEKM
jgi:arginyl-tRNA synthetase